MSNNYNQTLQSNNTDLQAILDTVNELPNAGGSNPILQDKTVTPTTSVQKVIADNNYDGLNEVTVNAMPTATQATPTISINSSTGLITATATQTAGYVAAGTKSATKQLAFQAAQTITPGTTNKTIAANTYLGGVQTIKGDVNLVAGNIKSGTSIFGVTDTYVGSGGDTSVEDGLITKTLTITSYTNDRVTTIGKDVFSNVSTLRAVNFPACRTINSYAFYGCSKLSMISFPNTVSISAYAFQSCSSLTEAKFPLVTTIGSSAFSGCTNLESIDFPLATIISQGAFLKCSKLNNLIFPNVKSIRYNAFMYCSNLNTIYLMGSTVCYLGNSEAFSGTGISSASGSIFVRASLLASYQSNTNWTYFRNRIFAYNEDEGLEPVNI